MDLLALAQTLPAGDSGTPFTIFVVGALASLGGFTAKLVLDTISDLRKRLDTANARTETAILTGHEVTTALAQLTTMVDKLVESVGREHHPTKDGT